MAVTWVVGLLMQRAKLPQWAAWVVAVALAIAIACAAVWGTARGIKAFVNAERKEAVEIYRTAEEKRRAEESARLEREAMAAHSQRVEGDRKAVADLNGVAKDAERKEPGGGADPIGGVSQSVIDSMRAKSRD